jgi:predicted transcriptional regulator
MTVRVIAAHLALTFLMSGAALAQAPVDLEVDLGEQPDCVEPAPCVVGYDAGLDPGVGDDTVELYQRIERVGVKVEAGIGPLFAVDVDLASASVEHGLGPQAGGVLDVFHTAYPSEVGAMVDVWVDEEGVGLRYPMLDSNDGHLFFYDSGLVWSDDFVNHTHLHVPYTTYVRDTDYIMTVHGCPLHVAVVLEYTNAACEAAGYMGLFAFLLAATPDVVFGAEAHEFSVLSVGRDRSSAEEVEGQHGVAWTLEDGDAPVHRNVLESFAAVVLESAVVDLAQAAPGTSSSGPGDVRLSVQSPVPGGGPGPPSWAVALVLLLALPLVWLYHRITGKRCLEHASRSALLDLARTQPGILMGEAARVLGCSFHTAEHHVRILKRSGELDALKVGRNVAIYPLGSVPLKSRAALVHLRRGPQAAALRAIHLNVGIGLVELAALLGSNKSSTHAKLRRLQGHGLIERDAAGGYVPTEAGMEMLRLLERWPPSSPVAEPQPLEATEPAFPTEVSAPSPAPRLGTDAYM